MQNSTISWRKIAPFLSPLISSLFPLIGFTPPLASSPLFIRKDIQPTKTYGDTQKYGKKKKCCKTYNSRL